MPDSASASPVRLRRRDLRATVDSSAMRGLQARSGHGERGTPDRPTRRRLREMAEAAAPAVDERAERSGPAAPVVAPEADDATAQVTAPAQGDASARVGAAEQVEAAEPVAAGEQVEVAERRMTRRELRLASEQRARRDAGGRTRPLARAVAASTGGEADAGSTAIAAHTDAPDDLGTAVATDLADAAPAPDAPKSSPSDAPDQSSASADTSAVPDVRRRTRREHHAADRAAARGRRGRARHARYRPTLQTSAAAAAAAVVVLGATMQLVGQGDAVADANLGTTPVVSTPAVPTFSTLADASSSAGEVAPELLATPGAASRADYTAAARSDARSALSCSPNVAASGARAAFDVENAAVMPMATGSYRLTSPYGQRVHPITGQSSFHTGTDMAASYGTPIYAVADGVVTHAGPGVEGRSGTLVIIEHEYQGQTFETWSTHMSPSGVHVSEGDTVQAGQQIAEVGSYGNSTGPHLHIEVHVDGDTVEPLAFFRSIEAGDPTEAC